MGYLKEKGSYILNLLKKELKDYKTITIFLIVVTILYSPTWLFYILYCIFKFKQFFIIATLFAMFWAGPFTPFFPICIAITFIVKKIINKKDIGGVKQK